MHLKFLHQFPSLKLLEQRRKIHPLYSQYVCRNFNNICLHNRLSGFDSHSQVINLFVLPSVHTGCGDPPIPWVAGSLPLLVKMTSICYENKIDYSVPPLPLAPSWRAQWQLYITNTVLQSSIIWASCTLCRNCNWTHAVEIWHPVLLRMTHLLREFFHSVVYLSRVCMLP